MTRRSGVRLPGRCHFPAGRLPPPRARGSCHGDFAYPASAFSPMRLHRGGDEVQVRPCVSRSRKAEEVAMATIEYPATYAVPGSLDSIVEVLPRYDNFIGGGRGGPGEGGGQTEPTAGAGG